MYIEVLGPKRCFSFNTYVFIVSVDRFRCKLGTLTHFTFRSFSGVGDVVSFRHAIQGWRFLFFIGVAHALGALGNDQRGPTVCAHGGTESLPPLLDNFSGNSRADLFLGMRRCVPPGMKSPRHTGN